VGLPPLLDPVDDRHSWRRHGLLRTSSGGKPTRPVISLRLDETRFALTFQTACSHGCISGIAQATNLPNIDSLGYTPRLFQERTSWRRNGGLKSHDDD